MIWVIGDGGAGTEICRALEKEKLQFVKTSAEVDSRDFKALKDFADEYETKNYFNSHQRTGRRAEIKWIVNCEKSSSAQNTARVARALGAKLIHISNGFVFDGTARIPYPESAPKRPVGENAQKQSLAEDEIQRTMTQFFILRTTGLYGPSDSNFVTDLIKKLETENEIKISEDQNGAPCFSENLAQAVLKIIKQNEKTGINIFSKDSLPYGIYNFTDSGETSPYGFAKELQRLLVKYKKIQNKCSIIPCSSEETGEKQVYPLYSVLNREKIISALKIKIPKWQDGLEKFIKEL